MHRRRRLRFRRLRLRRCRLHGLDLDPQENCRKEPAATDAQIASRITGELRFYDGLTHLGLFGVPKWLRAAVESEERIMTIENPVFMH